MHSHCRRSMNLDPYLSRKPIAGGSCLNKPAHPSSLSPRELPSAFQHLFPVGKEKRESFALWGESKINSLEQKSCLSLLPNLYFLCLFQSKQEADSSEASLHLCCKTSCNSPPSALNRHSAVVTLAPPFCLPGKSCAELAAASLWPAELLTSISTSLKSPGKKRAFPVFILCKYGHNNFISLVKPQKKSGSTPVCIRIHSTHTHECGYPPTLLSPLILLWLAYKNRFHCDISLMNISMFYPDLPTFPHC